MKLEDVREVENNLGVKSDRKPYTQPTLRFFGAVTHFTQGSLGSVGDAGSQTMPPSDVRLKENIALVGRHPLGFGLYLFDYRPGACGMERQPPGRQFGVLAQEVEALVPEAVLMHADGYRRVNYAMLGITHSAQNLH